MLPRGYGSGGILKCDLNLILDGVNPDKHRDRQDSQDKEFLVNPVSYPINNGDSQILHGIHRVVILIMNLN